MEIRSAAEFVRVTREALVAAGFVRKSVGDTVYWECGDRDSDAAPFVLVHGINDHAGSWFAVAPALAQSRGSAVPGSGVQGMTAPHPASGHPLPALRGEGQQTKDAQDPVALLPAVRGEGARRADEGRVARRNSDELRGTPTSSVLRRVIIPDLAGHGESGPSGGPLPLSLLLERLDAVIGDERDITLVGNSLGGWIATLYALAHPERVKHLVLEAGGGLARPLASPILPRDREEAMAILRSVHGPRSQPPEWAIEALLERAVDSPLLRLTEVEEHVLDARLRDLHVPTTLIWGADDGVLPVSYAKEFCGLVHGAKLHVLEGAAHIPHIQQREKFLQCLMAIS